jgi:hypothetical protein
MMVGVPVMGFWESFSGYAVYDTHCINGAHIKIEDLAGRLHHKFAIIDVDRLDPTVIL